MNENDEVFENLRVAEKLRKENKGQFFTLCRMHLSFEIDLELENNESNEKPKSKLWNKFHKKTSKCTATSSSSPTQISLLMQMGINQCKKLITFLMKDENITQEGIFRKTGSLARQNELKNALIEEVDLDLENNSYTAHDCASVLKTILAEMDEPLISLNYYFAFQQVADIYNAKVDCNMRESRLLNSLQLLFLLIPNENRILMQLVVELLHETIRHEHVNKMTSESLSTLFTPHLVCPRKLNSEALYNATKSMYGIVSFIIKTGSKLFHIPTRLATDIKAYFMEQNRRKTMSPEQILNESVTSETTASTVFTFVDREKTAQAHDMETTDTALAELYAYIVSLPESSRKKKLIHKFNKENGKGTPLQFINLQRDKNSTGLLAKAIGSSIKKHIFHKNFLSKTPKRTPVSSQPSNMPVRTLFSDTTNTPKSSLKTITQPGPELTNNVFTEVNFANEELHKVNHMQRMSGRSVSDSHLNKTIDHEIATTFKEKSASIGDLQSITEMNELIDSDECCITPKLENNYLLPYTNVNIIASHGSTECIETPKANEFDNIICGTPINSLSRRSMSPITKSTKRMPKSMQESIMTPRSRKPITAIESLSSTNKSNTFESLLEESENENSMLLGGCDAQHTGFVDYINNVTTIAVNPDLDVGPVQQSSLTDNFKEYLRNRSVLHIQESPPDDDASFTSHPDDFIDNIKDLSESEMSQSMLYCLDGNNPDRNDSDCVNLKKRSSDEVAQEPNAKKMYICTLGETSL